MSNAGFTTVINCMDGRTQLQVNEFLRKRDDAEYVDTITEPGPIKILAEGNEEDLLVDSILSRIDISVHKHGSSSITVVAHYDCTGNPVEEDVQRAQAAKAVDLLKAKYPECRIGSVWVGDDWQVEEIA